MYYADRAVVVVNPEVSSVRDSDRILGLLASKTQRAEQGTGRQGTSSADAIQPEASRERRDDECG